MDDLEPKIPMAVRGFAWRVTATIILGVGWLSFFILWLFFYAGNWEFYQSLAIIIVSVLVAIGALAAMWASFGLKMAERAAAEDASFGPQFKRWTGTRGIASSLLWIGWLVFLVIWLFFFAGSWNIYQNLGVLIVSLLIVGGISSLVWRSFWRRW